MEYGKYRCNLLFILFTNCCLFTCYVLHSTQQTFYSNLQASIFILLYINSKEKKKQIKNNKKKESKIRIIYKKKIIMFSMSKKSERWKKMILKIYKS